MIKKQRISIRLLVLVLISCLIPVQNVLAGDIPAKVKPQEVKATYMAPTSTGGYSMSIIGGKAVKSTASLQYQEGDIVGIPVDLVYTCTFYNVGEMGGSQYGKATLSVTPIGRGGGLKYVMFKHPAHPEPYLITEQQIFPPEFKPEVLLQGTFSGGPDGSFKFTNAEGQEVTGFLTEEGTKLTKMSGPGGKRILITKDTGYLTVLDPGRVWYGWFEATPQESEAVDGDPKAARVSGCTGQVEIRLPGADEDDWHLVKMDTVIPVGAHIRTQEDSKAILSFSDMSTFVLKAESEIVITSPPGPQSKIKLVAGNIWANFKRMVTEGSMEVEMNEAVAGIKGTTFVCEEIDGKSALKVIEGTVEFTAKADGKKVMVQGGDTVSANQNGLGKLEKFDVQKEQALWKQATDSHQQAAAPDTARDTTSNSVNKIIYIVVAAVVLIVGAGIFTIRRKKHSA